MREVQNSTRSSSNGSISSENRSVEDATGWDADFNDPIGVNSKEFNFRIIDLANKKVNLLAILKGFKVELIEKGYSPSGWTHTCCCPFPDHNDSSPSFHCNTKENSYKCFGCNRRGGPVQLISVITGRKPLEVAKEIISRYSSIEEVYNTITDSLSDKTDDLLNDFSEYIRNFIQSHKLDAKAIKYAESIMWCLDIYLSKHIPNLSINIANLEARINILKGKLDKYE